METKTMDLNYLQKKMNQVRKSCVTPEHKAAYAQYVQLYRNMLARYNKDFHYRFRVDMIMLFVTGGLIALLLVTAALMLLSKIQ